MTARKPAPMMNAIKAASILYLLVSVPGAAMAEVIATTFGPADSFATNTGAVIGSEDLIRQGAPVTIPNDLHYLLDYVEIPLSVAAFDGIGSFTLDVMTDDSGLPGVIVESFQFLDVTAEINSGGAEIFRGTSSGNSVLTAGQTYWLVGSAVADQTGHTPLMVWHLSGIFTRRATSSIDNVPWHITNLDLDDPIMAYRVAATPIPEPTTLALAVLGLMGCAGRWRQRR